MGRLHDREARLTLPMLLPRPDALTAAFWTGGARGRLMIAQCGECRRFHHPPTTVCGYCRARDIVFTAVSGRGTIEAVTIDFHAGQLHGATPPIIAIVRLAEADDLRMLSRIVTDNPTLAAPGMKVTVWFERHDDIYLPLFVPQAG